MQKEQETRPQYTGRRSIGGFRIARIRGVDLKVHFSLIFLLIYIVMIASSQFTYVVGQSRITPSRIGGTPLEWGFIFSFGLFLSVVLHEFGHVLVAQSMGVRVTGVTLMMLGGASEMEKIPDQPYSEFKVSIIGPLVSLAIAGILYGAYRISPSPSFALFAFWVGRVNLALAIFNLLPAFPLDGGRVLRSILAAKQGSLQATKTVVSIAKTLAWVLGFLGFLQFNFLLMLIAVFIYSAANSELIVSISKSLLDGYAVGQVGERIEAVPESDSIKQAALKMVQGRIRILPVQSSNNIPFLITVDQLRRVPKDQWATTRVREVMSPAVRVLDISTPVNEIIQDLAVVGAMPFSDQGVVVGIIQYKNLADIIDFKSLDQNVDRRTG